MPAYNWLTQNSKMKKTEKKTGLKVLNWGIPAYQSSDGFITCPNAGACGAGCYANAGAYRFSNVAKVFDRRLELSMKPGIFIKTMIDEIERRKPDIIRIHDSGDFYGPEYTYRWFAICIACPTVKFYAYTKEIERFKTMKDIPHNLHLIYSYGGKQDKLINPETDRHCKVFPNLKALKAAGYVDGTEDDSVAAYGKVKKIGLVYHGTKSFSKTNWNKVKGK